MPIYDCTPDGGGSEVKISPAADNATQIYQGGIYTPVVFQTKVSPLIVVATNPSTPDVEITAKKGEMSLSAMTNSEGVAEIEVSNFGTWTVSGTLDSELIEISVPVRESRQYDVKLAVRYPIYGAIWDGGADSKWNRTDEAELFEDPSPAVNNGTGSSPFDDIMPWSGMTRISDPVAGELVQIPKYWYKWTRSGSSMKLQIANEPIDGFYVSPAHADRGDGQGERDIVYVGRHHCASTYKSTSGVLPIVDITSGTARTNIHNLGEDIWLYDFQMFWTIAMLYLVEYANWNSQEAIGYGCSPAGSSVNMGATDGMLYHTGTAAATRETYGICQYRHIEGLWDNALDWTDNVRFSGNTVYCFNTPGTYSDTTGGTEVGTRVASSGYVTEWTNPTVEGFEFCLIPSAVGGSATTYICDNYWAGGNGFAIGGGYSQALSRGMFAFANDGNPNTTDRVAGCRLQKLPNNT